MAIDRLDHLLALHVTPASAEDRGEVERLARTMQAVTNDAAELAWVDQGYTGERAANAAARHGIALEVVKLPEAKALLREACRRTGLRPLAATLCCRTVIRMGEPLPTPRQRLRALRRNTRKIHVVAFACLMVKQAAAFAAG